MTLLSASIPRGVSFARVVRLALVWAAAACVVMNESADAARRRRAVRPGTPADQQAADLAWFARLDYPDVKGARPALVATGSWEHHHDDPPKNTYRCGFVLRSDAKSFTVFFPNLTTEKFERTAPGTPEHLRRDFEQIEPAKFLEVYREHLRTAQDIRERTFDWQYRNIGLFADTFVAAACYARLGDGKTAAELYQLANRAHEADGRFAVPTPTFSERLRTELPEAAMLHALGALADSRTFTRAEAAAEFARLAKNYPTSKQAETARERAAILRRMAEEDREHAQRRKAGKPFEELSREEQIAELVFQLRDQYGRPGPMGDYDAVDMDAEKKDTPGHKLVEIGYDAVPQLIAALDDERLCRVAHGRHVPDSVLTVGDCAYRTINLIAGRTFWESPPDKPEETSRQRMEAWYAEVRRKGEKQYLLDAVAIGDDAGADLAERLVTKYPQDALPALLAGAKRAADSDARHGIVRAIGNVPGDEPVPFLTAELISGSTPSDRLCAARALHRRGRPEPIPAMIAELKKLPNEIDDPFLDDRFFREALIEFLVESARPDGISAIGELLPRRKLDERMEIARTFGEPDVVLALKNGSSEARRAALRILLTLLDETERRYGMSRGRIDGGRTETDLHVWLFAAEALHKLDAEKFPFDEDASEEDRERSRLLLRNIVRAELGLPAIPLRRPHTIRPVADAALQPLLSGFDAASDEERVGLTAKFVELGVGALPGIRAHRDRLPAQSPLRALYERLVQDLATIVIEINLIRNSVPADATLDAQLAALKNRSLSAAALLDLHTALASDVTPNGLDIVSKRPAARASRGSCSAWSCSIGNARNRSSVVPVVIDRAPCRSSGHTTSTSVTTFASTGEICTPMRAADIGMAPRCSNPTHRRSWPRRSTER
jgi:hypothetical protein